MPSVRFPAASGRQRFIREAQAAAGLHHLVGTPWVDGPPPRGISAADLLTATIENLERFAADVAPAVR